MQSARPNLKTLLQALPREFHSLQQEEQRLSLELYRLLAAGRPVALSQLASVLEMPEPTVKAILSQWPGVYFDEHQSVIGYWGLAISEMAHRFEIQGRLLYTWCAWDSLFIPELIQQAAMVTSTCPVTGEAIRLRVGPDGVQNCHPAGAVMSFLTPPAESFQEDVVQHFCHYIHFFSSPEAGAQWVNQHAGTFLLSLDEAAALAQMKNRIQYPILNCPEAACRG